MGVFLRRFPQVRTDFPALVDEWASRFFEELDYIKEGNNGIRFADYMAKQLPQVCHRKGTLPVHPLSTSHLTRSIDRLTTLQLPDSHTIKASDVV